MPLQIEGWRYVNPFSSGPIKGRQITNEWWLLVYLVKSVSHTLKALSWSWKSGYCDAILKRAWTLMWAGTLSFITLFMIRGER